MRFLRGLIGAKEDSLVDIATGLLPAARIHATTTFTPLLDRYPFIPHVDDKDIENWDFVLTVAGVFIAATRLNSLKLGDSRESKLMKLVAEDMDQWKPDGIDGFEDCKRLFESEFDRLETTGQAPDFLASDALGMWIVLNVLKRQSQTDEEFQLVRVTGLSAINAFYDWWEKPEKTR